MFKARMCGLADWLIDTLPRYFPFMRELLMINVKISQELMGNMFHDPAIICDRIYYGRVLSSKTNLEFSRAIGYLAQRGLLLVTGDVSNVVRTKYLLSCLGQPYLAW